MKPLEKLFHKLEGKLSSIKRDTEIGRYTVEVAFPINWEYDENDDIAIEKLIETEEGVLLSLKPKSDTIVLDDLVEFINIIVETNEQLEEMKKKYDALLEEEKRILREKHENFKKEMENVKKERFKLKNEISESKPVEKKKAEKKEVEETTEEKVLSKISS